MIEKRIAKEDYEIAFIVAVELAMNPPLTEKEMIERLNQQPVEDKIKMLACELLIEWANKVRKEQHAISRQMHT